MVKLIKLQAFGGYLWGNPIAVPRNTREWRVPVFKNNNQNFLGADALLLGDVPNIKQLKFLPTGLFEFLPNGNSIEIYEMEWD